MLSLDIVRTNTFMAVGKVRFAPVALSAIYTNCCLSSVFLEHNGAYIETFFFR